MKKYILIVLIFNLLQNCSSVSEGFKLKKGNTGDEFLVEKKNPLVLPPDFNDLPEPESSGVASNNEEDTFQEKIANNTAKDKSENIISDASSTEDFILKNIKKNESD